ncbi:MULTISPECIES: hypothetical protein [unclassified Ensifer]|uniref:hypothetical protein n=1 Tax=unclassified Ensifer TaxID=2633371 RepID=UPI00070C8485|nr:MULTISPECIES: hypothetical protein [unclassified Ensifer]KQW47206.1 hypothetical protein ASD02_34440 [Ensifer sp. Root1252]KRC68758.1 hypothetical protein ASE32_35270 [Ensifer sp. Root231]KRC93924.1 hypothetical protein ASE47_34935 [Ensifer sp. Root258]
MVRQLMFNNIVSLQLEIVVMKVSILAVVSISILVAAVVFANADTSTFRGGAGEELFPIPVFFVILQGVLLVLGMFCASFHQRMRAQMEQGVQNIRLRRDLRQLTSAPSFWLAMSAAPIIFCVIVKLTDGMSVAASCIVAFQNGFFWQKVLPISERQIAPIGYGEPSPTREKGAQ